MKHLKLFEEYDELSIEDDLSLNDTTSDERTRPYASGNIVDGVIVVDAIAEFDDNPLFYMWSEYPKYSIMDNGKLVTNYEFYLDKDGNKYFVLSDIGSISSDDIRKYIAEKDWNYARNVDTFVDNADKEDYATWLDMIA